MLTASFWLSQEWSWNSSLWSLPALKIGASSRHVFTSVCPSLPSSSGVHTCIWPQDLGEGHGVLGATWGICKWGIPRGLWVGFLMGSAAVSRTHNPLMPSESLWCSSSSSGLRACSSWLSTPERVREGWASLIVTCTAGEAGCHSHILTFPAGKVTGEKPLALACVSLRGRVMWVKSDRSSHPLQCVLTVYLFVLVVCWNFSGNLDFHKRSVTHGWLSKAVSSRGSQTVAEGPEQVHGPLQGPQPGARHMGGLRLLPGPLAYGAGSRSHKGTLFCGRIPNCCCWGVGGGNEGTMLLTWPAEHFFLSVLVHSLLKCIFRYYERDPFPSNISLLLPYRKQLLHVYLQVEHLLIVLIIFKWFQRS